MTDINPNDEPVVVSPNEPLNKALVAFCAPLLAALGGWVVAKGWFTAEQWATITGAVGVLAVACWRAYVAHRTGSKLRTLAADPRVPDNIATLKK